MIPGSLDVVMVMGGVIECEQQWAVLAECRDDQRQLTAKPISVVGVARLGLLHDVCQ